MLEGLDGTAVMIESSVSVVRPVNLTRPTWEGTGNVGRAEFTDSAPGKPAREHDWSGWGEAPLGVKALAGSHPASSATGQHKCLVAAIHAGRLNTSRRAARYRQRSDPLISVGGSGTDRRRASSPDLHLVCRG